MQSSPETWPNTRVCESRSLWYFTIVLHLAALTCVLFSQPPVWALSLLAALLSGSIFYYAHRIPHQKGEFDLIHIRWEPAGWITDHDGSETRVSQLEGFKCLGFCVFLRFQSPHKGRWQALIVQDQMPVRQYRKILLLLRFSDGIKRC